ncbi:MAG: hypothetical protein EBR82_31970 [Caulobacteraceae bacterium]|nr:hypothetical protein [Caulobacteraceae bacterium]
MSEIDTGREAVEQRHPAARIKWCGYPAPDSRHAAQDCLRWMGGSVDEPADCRGCVHLAWPKTESKDG